MAFMLKFLAPVPMVRARTMRPPVECPKCRTVNEPSTTECDCGYNFVTKGWTRSKTLPGVDDSARREMAAVEDIARTYQRLVYIMIASPAVGALIRGLMWLSRGHDTATLLAMFVSIVLLLISLDMLLRTVYRLADGIGVTPVLYAVGSLIPVVGFLMLLSLCAEARDWTKRQGLVIGLLGPTAVSLEAFRARFGAPAGIRNETFARSLAPARARSRA
jgi:hypothetical protein